MGLALIQEYQADELTTAIVQADIKKLSKAHGIGKRTAERIAVELRSKLSEFNSMSDYISFNENISTSCQALNASTMNEIHTTLSSLGYEDLEIRRALKAIVSTSDHNHTNENNAPQHCLPNDAEAWIKASLIWLSKEAA